MSIVRVFKGKFSVGREAFREFTNKDFPLVDGRINRNEKGEYITVNAIPVRGFPKRHNLKIFIDDASCFQVLDDSVNPELAIHAAQNAPTSAGEIEGFRAPVEVAAPMTEEDIIASLNGEDDGEIKEMIEDRFHKLNQLVYAAASGEITGIVVSGPPGVGKSFGVEQALAQEEDLMDVQSALAADADWEEGDDLPEREPKLQSTIIRGHVAPGGLYETLHAYSGPRNVVVFDDSDSVLHNDKSLNFLKTALDQGHQRVLSWRSSTTKIDAPSRFVFNGAVIFITNLDFEKPNARNSELAAHLEAIMSRVYYLDLAMPTLRHRYLRIEQVCVDYGVLKKMGLDEEQVQEVWQFFKRNLMKFREVSIRTVQKIAKMRLINAGEWEEFAELTTFRKECQTVKRRK